MAKIDIISGILGAGKTTLIKKLLGDALKGQQVVLIENEFGEIGIDGGFLKDAGIEITEMNSGCICCSLVGDFGTALKEVVEKYHPDRIVIEPSGVGKLSDVIKAVQRNAESDLVLNSATTVVDVTKAKMYLKNFGEFFKNQVEAAGTIILSRMDTPKATEAKVSEAMALIRELNPKATIITTPVEELSGAKVLDTMEGKKIDLSLVEEEHEHHHHHDDEECACGHHHDGEHHHHHEDEECECGHHHDGEHHHHHDGEECACGHHHHHADEVFTSWGKETIRKYTKDEITEILTALSADRTYGFILRAKGMVESTDGTWIYFDMVPGEADVREGEPEYTGRLCVIGSELKEDKIAELFKLS
jgi:G3E family GTPase